MPREAKVTGSEETAEGMREVEAEVEATGTAGSGEFSRDELAEELDEEWEPVAEGKDMVAGLLIKFVLLTKLDQTALD